jgi:hypothetical protein
MRRPLIAFIVICVVIGVVGLDAAPAYAQDATPPVFHLKFPSFVPGDDAEQAPPKEMTPQGGVPTPRPTYANQPKQPFAPTRLSKVVLYGLQLTFYEHVMRVATQSFTREQLKGEFWPEYFDSVRVPEHWHDKDGWEVNYLGHAIHGGAFTRIWLEQREGKATSKTQYFKQLGRAFVYTSIFSLQYEIGPMSEASIGNVGLNREDVGWVDLVWTPIGGVLWTMGEDAIDKYALTWVDKHVPFKMAKVAARLIGNPSRMLANVSQNRSPWSRPDRDIDGNKRK